MQVQRIQITPSGVECAELTATPEVEQIPKSKDLLQQDLNAQFLDIYLTFKDAQNPPEYLETVKRYLELEGILPETEKIVRGVV